MAVVPWSRRGGLRLPGDPSIRLREGHVITDAGSRTGLWGGRDAGIDPTTDHEEHQAPEEQHQPPEYNQIHAEHPAPPSRGEHPEIRVLHGLRVSLADREHDLRRPEMIGAGVTDRGMAANDQDTGLVLRPPRAPPRWASGRAMAPRTLQ